MTDKLVQLSNFSQNEIDELITEFEHLLISHLFSHYRDYELDYNSDVESIIYISKMLVFAGLKRGLNAGAYRGLSLGIEHTEVVKDNTNNQKKNGLFSWLKL